MAASTDPAHINSQLSQPDRIVALLEGLYQFVLDMKQMLPMNENALLETLQSSRVTLQNFVTVALDLQFSNLRHALDAIDMTLAMGLSAMAAVKRRETASTLWREVFDDLRPTISTLYIEMSCLNDRRFLPMPPEREVEHLRIDLDRLRQTEGRVMGTAPLSQAEAVVLKAVAEGDNVSATLSVLSNRVRVWRDSGTLLSRSTIYKCLKVLEVKGYVQKMPRKQGWVIASRPPSPADNRLHNSSSNVADDLPQNVS